MSSKKILIALGSPRKNGNSTLLAHKAAEGIENAGGAYEMLHLHALDIKSCKACDWCRGNIGSFCVTKDDMQPIYPKLREAEGLIIASPVYWFTVSAQAKLFMDRWYAFVDSEGYLFRGKGIGIILSFGDSDVFTSGAVNALRTFQDAFGYVEARIIGSVYGSANDPGEIKSNHDLLEKAFQLGKKMVEETGKGS